MPVRIFVRSLKCCHAVRNASAIVNPLRLTNCHASDMIDRKSVVFIVIERLVSFIFNPQPYLHPTAVLPSGHQLLGYCTYLLKVRGFVSVAIVAVAVAVVVEQAGDKRRRFFQIAVAAAAFGLSCFRFSLGELLQLVGDRLFLDIPRTTQGDREVARIGIVASVDVPRSLHQSAFVNLHRCHRFISFYVIFTMQI